MGFPSDDEIRAAHEGEVNPCPSMDSLTFDKLREMNIARNNRWHPEGLKGWSLSDWGVAMAGEAGEALNVIKKLNRERDSITGNDDTTFIELKKMLAHELADTLIYLDLLAARAGINLEEAVIEKFNKVSIKNNFPERLS